MKATVINDTTFRLYAITLDGFGAFAGASNYLHGKWCKDYWGKHLDNWLDTQTPGWSVEYCSDEISESTYHYETFLKFKTPADAVAFKLRWL